MGFCIQDMPELFTSLLNEEVNNFVQSIALPQHKYSICETEVDKHPLGHVVSLHLHLDFFHFNTRRNLFNF